MKRRNGSGRFLPQSEGEDINPLDGMANLADVMLVFACGLMLALITFWNVDVVGTSRRSDLDVPRQELTETVSDVSSSQGEEIDSEGLEEYGRVYRDPETGKLYLVPEEG